MSIAPVKSAARWVRKQLSRHLLFGITAGLILGLYFGVSQVRTILLQALTTGAGGFVFHEIVLVVGSLIGALFFIGSIVEVVPWDLPGWLNRVAGPCARMVDHVVSPVQRLLGWLAARPLATGVPILLLGVLMFAAGANPGGGRWFPLAGAICKNFACLFVSVGIFIAFGARLLLPVAWPPRTHDERVAYATARYLAWLIVCMLIGETIWFLDGVGLSGTYTGFTVWAFAHVGMILIVGASLCDYLHSFSGWPIRVVALIVAAGLLWICQSPVRVGREEPNPPDAAGVRKAWYDHMVGRLRGMSDRKLPGPAVVVVASGGGSRAALFTSLVLEQLAREPMTIPSPGVLPYAAAGGTWGDHILLISSVSGGSLATGHYVQRGGGRSRDLEAMRTVSKPDLQAELQKAFRDWIARLGDGPSEKELKEAARKAQARPMPCTEYFDDMGTDFMGPVLRGTLTPALARSTALSAYWTNRFGWGASSRLHGYTHADSGTRYVAGRDPAVLFNATDADKGTRIIIGFPPLPEKLLNCDYELLSGQERTPFEIGELNPAWDLTLGEAVRLSANFPWGFQIARMKDRDGNTLHLLDGGVVDNGGLDSVNYLFRGVAAAAKAKDPEAADLMALLKARGVLVVEIDSGAKPSYAASTAPWAWMTEPSRALSNSAFTAADLSRDFHKKGLMEVLRPEGRRRRNAAGAGLEPVLWATLRCNHWDPDTDVMTAWALGTHHKAVILTRFLVEWEQWNRDKLKDEALALREARGAVTETAAAEVARELRAGLENPPAGSQEQVQKVADAMNEIDRRSHELEMMRSMATSELKPNIDRALQTLETGKKALETVKPGDAASLKKAVADWKVEPPSKQLRDPIDMSQSTVNRLREERQQTLLNSLEFFQVQQKKN